MKNTNQTWEQMKEQGRVKFSIIQGAILGIIFSLLKNRGVIWSILNGETSKIEMLLIDTSLLVAGGILGYFTIVWWVRSFLHTRKK